MLLFLGYMINGSFVYQANPDQAYNHTTTVALTPQAAITS